MGMNFLKDKREERRKGRGKKEEGKGRRERRGEGDRKRGREAGRKGGGKKTEETENRTKYTSFRVTRVSCAFLVVPYSPQREGLCHS